MLIFIPGWLRLYASDIARWKKMQYVKGFLGTRDEKEEFHFEDKCMCNQGITVTAEKN